MLLANLISIPYLGPKRRICSSKCKGHIIPAMKILIYYYDDYLLSQYLKKTLKIFFCKLYDIDDGIINRLYQIYEAEIIDWLNKDVEGILAFYQI